MLCPLVSLECRLRLLVKKSLSNNTTLLAEYWKQRGKVRDCVLGDDNTKYFQMCATIRLRKNQIRVLDPGDTLVFSHSGKEKILHDFYHNLLGIPSPTKPLSNLPSLLNHTALDSFQSSSLIAPFSLTEIKKALWAMKNDSSPGPDGFGPAFFKFFWNLVNPSLVTLFEEFYENVADLQRINKSHIVLLPKKVGVTKPDQFRPISL